jgi:hypothetical protein
MHPRFQGDPNPRHSPEDFFHCPRRCRQLLFHNHFSGFIQNAVPARTVSQNQPDVQLLIVQISRLLDSKRVMRDFRRSVIWLQQLQQNSAIGELFFTARAISSSAGKSASNSHRRGE